MSALLSECALARTDCVPLGLVSVISMSPRRWPLLVSTTSTHSMLTLRLTKIVDATPALLGSSGTGWLTSTVPDDQLTSGATRVQFRASATASLALSMPKP